MKKAPLILLVCVMMGISAFAQTRPNRALYLNMGGSYGVASSYDNGTVPFFIMGSSNIQTSGITYGWKRYETNLEFRSINTTLKNPAGTCLDYDVYYDLLYRIHDSESGRWHQWVGGDVDAFIDIRQIPSLQNQPAKRIDQSFDVRQSWPRLESRIRLRLQQGQDTQLADRLWKSEPAFGWRGLPSRLRLRGRWYRGN